MQSLALSHPHIVRTFQFHSCIRKERIPWKTPRRHALRSQSLRWHYPNQVRSKIYLPLSLSHKLPLALFFSVFQYSTHLSRCQTSTVYCSLHSHRRRYCSLRSQQHAFAMHRIYGNRINSRGMSRVFCDLRSQKTPRGTLPVNSNELFHITVHPDVHFFQGMGNILIPERSSGQISIQPSHLSFIKLCVRRIFLFDRPA